MYEAEALGKEKAYELYKKEHKLQKIRQDNGEASEEKIRIDKLELIEIEKTEDDKHKLIITYRYVYNVALQPIGKRRYQNVETYKDLYITIYETQLTDGRYSHLIRDYCKFLLGLDKAKEYPEITSQISQITGNKMPFKALYFGLQYYYDLLKKPFPKEAKDIVDCKKYCYQGLGYYTLGKEWRTFFSYMCTDIFNVQKNDIQENLAKKSFQLFEEYGYTCEDLQTALTYYYKIKEKPVPDKPHLNFVPLIMQEAKEHIMEYEERQLLINYIYKLFNLDENENYPLIQAEVRKYHNREYGKLTYKGMMSTLDYYYNIMGNPLPPVPNVGIIPYQYNNALNFYKQRKAVKDNGGLPSTVPVVRIAVSREARLKSQQLYEDRYKWKPTKLISEIEVEEDETFDRL